jgi:aldehyde reductase
LNYLQVERGVIVIPKSVTKTRIEQNFDIFDFQIGESDMQYIDSLDCNGRFCHVTWMNDSPDFPFSIEF